MTELTASDSSTCQMNLDLCMAVQVGELIDGRYDSFATHGKGVFSTVVRARDMQGVPDAAGQPPEVAIKMLRNNDVMRKVHTDWIGRFSMALPCVTWHLIHFEDEQCLRSFPVRRLVRTGCFVHLWMSVQCCFPERF